MRIVALDYGEARMGVALSDPSGSIARPLGTIARPDSKQGEKRLLDLLRKVECKVVVVGLPLALKGGETDQSLKVRAFARRLERLLLREAKVELFDERFTTKLAQQRAREAQTRAPEDALAAACLLESYLARDKGRESDG